MASRKKEENYYETLLQDLQDPEEAEAYINAALQDEDTRVFLLALKNVVSARGRGRGMSALSKDTDLNRESLYRSLSKEGNPKTNNLRSILKALDLELRVQSIRKN